MKVKLGTKEKHGKRKRYMGYAWREIIARRGESAYVKFFEKKAGFVSKKWVPYFANYRRDGYDFDALWES